ncbi:ABC transporter permease [Paracoccus luteus]|uniref:ABC transporter permease n=1 Tax=Paracoccus luteus TaxID=2508543 RepID=UPI001FEC8BC6|nr:ABC transporter permease [Paracoccus luteus]
MTVPASSAPQRPGQPARGPRFRMVRTVVALMLREISTTYGRSVGGYAWALLDPILGIALLTVVFQGALGAAKPMIGSNFPLFYATGYIPFVMYNDIANKMAASLRYSRPLLAYPAVTFVDALIARWLLNLATHLVVFFVVVGGIALIFRMPLVMDVGVVMQALGLIALLAAGVGTMNCFLIMRFPVWERAWSILNRPLFLMSAVFFTYESLPNVAQNVLWWNPLVHLIGLLRRGVYGVYPADYVNILYVASIAVGLFLFGLLLLWRRYRDLLELT